MKMAKLEQRWQQIKRGPYFTYLFLSLQVIVFLLMELDGLRHGVMNGSEHSLILLKYGAITPDAILIGHQYWRFVTPIFVHIGLFHLAINSLSLYFVGRLLEPIIGHVRFLVVYLLSGILGNVISFAFGNPYSVSAGASTSIFGMFAAFIILGRIYPYHPLIRQMSRSMTMLIVMNLVMNLFDSGVDILGHFGGALGGLLLMMIVGVPKTSYQFKEPIDQHKRFLSGVVFLFLIVFCLVYGFTFKG